MPIKVESTYLRSGRERHTRPLASERPCNPTIETAAVRPFRVESHIYSQGEP